LSERQKVSLLDKSFDQTISGEFGLTLSTSLQSLLQMPSFATLNALGLLPSDCKLATPSRIAVGFFIPFGSFFMD